VVAWADQLCLAMGVGDWLICCWALGVVDLLFGPELASDLLADDGLRFEGRHPPPTGDGLVNLTGAQAITRCSLQRPADESGMGWGKAEMGTPRLIANKRLEIHSKMTFPSSGAVKHTFLIP
jgi:hypothetical protein